jgi:hypothetical protein
MTKGVLPALNFLMQANRLNSVQLESGGILFTLVEEEVIIIIFIFTTRKWCMFSSRAHLFDLSSISLG